MDFEKSQTKQNLEKALQGEALAHLKYQWYKKRLTNINEKYANILDEIIHNEKEHGEIWFKKLHNGLMPNTEESLIDAITGERQECHDKYIKMGKTARTEGYNEIADLFFNIAQIECHHTETFKDIQEEIQEGNLFEQPNDTSQWKCLNCGHITEGQKPPKECPVCKHPQKYFTKGGE